MAYHKLSTRQIRRLKKVKDQILKFPELYDQSEIIHRAPAGLRSTITKNSCGTECCIAGWLYINDLSLDKDAVYNAMFHSGEKIIERACELVNAKMTEYGSWPNLFMPMYEWPSEFADQHGEISESYDKLASQLEGKEVDGKEGRILETLRDRALAQLAADRIDHYIETGE